MYTILLIQALNDKIHAVKVLSIDQDLKRGTKAIN